MNPEFELALKKQRLQFASATLRADFARNANGLRPLLGAADGVVAGVHWVRRHPPLIAALAIGVAVAKPRRAWRWARRAIVGWRAWRSALALAAGYAAKRGLL